jgi:hypothetical protein
MTKIWIVFFAALLFPATAAFASSWTDNFNTLNTDGNGTISRPEYEANIAKLKLGSAQPSFAVLDTDNSNSIDKDEWARAERIHSAYSKTNCTASGSSWCPCLNHPEKPECQ